MSPEVRPRAAKQKSNGILINGYGNYDIASGNGERRYEDTAAPPAVIRKMTRNGRRRRLEGDSGRRRLRRRVERGRPKGGGRQAFTSSANAPRTRGPSLSILSVRPDHTHPLRRKRARLAAYHPCRRLKHRDGTKPWPRYPCPRET